MSARTAPLSECRALGTWTKRRRPRTIRICCTSATPVSGVTACNGVSRPRPAHHMVRPAETAS
eukprot:7386817-Prymnesium_polylepis.1